MSWRWLKTHDASVSKSQRAEAPGAPHRRTLMSQGEITRNRAFAKGFAQTHTRRILDDSEQMSTSSANICISHPVVHLLGMVYLFLSSFRHQLWQAPWRRLSSTSCLRIYRYTTVVQGAGAAMSARLRVLILDMVSASPSQPHRSIDRFFAP